MKRIAIILDEALGKGQIGNVSAILMGQVALLSPDIFDVDLVLDKEGNNHAAIKYSTIVLKGNTKQIHDLVQKLRQDDRDIKCVVFTKTGQSLNDIFEEYKEKIGKSALVELDPVGAILVGSYDDVKAETKDFSLLS